jgi:hypothetical protein
MSRITPLPTTPLEDVDDARLDLAEELVPLAARLVVAVRDEGPDAVADVLAAVPVRPGETLPAWDALAVILAGMVDPARTMRQLLGWSLEAPVDTLGSHPPILTSAPAAEPEPVVEPVEPVVRRGPGRPPAPREHGTERGYRQHRTRREDACDPCRAAHLEHNTADATQVA